MQDTLVKAYITKVDDVGNTLNIKVDGLQDGAIYKYFIYENGNWNIIRDYTKENSIMYEQEVNESCMFMIQCRESEAEESQGYTIVERYKSEDEENVVYISSEEEEYEIGEKINIESGSNVLKPLYRYKVKSSGEWVTLKEYCVDNQFTYTPKKEGELELLVECKSADSLRELDCYEVIKFNIIGIQSAEIINFKCTSEEILVGKELVFKVDTTKTNRTILYKFMKLSDEGKLKTIQDYSTNATLKIVENNIGDYKVLCLVKDMYSERQYDDIASLNYNVKLYEPIIIKAFEADLASPQLVNTDIELKAIVKGGKNLLYRFIIDGEEKEDRGYIQSNVYIWQPKKHGTYSIKVYVKDHLFEGELEASSSFIYEIKKKKPEYISIKEVDITGSTPYVKGNPITLNVISKGGCTPLYKFTLYKDGKVYDEIPYNQHTSVTWTPRESGIYSVDVKVKDIYSEKEFDSNKTLNFDVLEYIPCKINYLLFNNKIRYMVKETLRLEAITLDCKDAVYKYILWIDNSKIEESSYSDKSSYDFSLPRVGRYKIELICKNKDSIEEFEDKQLINFNVYDAPEIRNTIVSIENKESLKVNTPINIKASNEGGKDVIYQFYIMKDGEWTLMQRYGKSNSYTFILNKKGDYKILCLSKNTFKRCNYEDFSIVEFTVSE